MRLGLLIVAASGLYLLSDVVEVVQGEFSTPQLFLTLVAEAAIPAFMYGLYLVLGAEIGRLGRLAAGVYAYAYVFFTGTVIYALVDGTRDYDALSRDLQPWMLLHGALMVFAGLGLGAALIRSAAVPRWTGSVLMVGVVLVAATQGWPDGAALVAAATRDLGFAGIGLALMKRRQVDRQRPSSSSAPRRPSGRPRVEPSHSRGTL